MGGGAVFSVISFDLLVTIFLVHLPVDLVEEKKINIILHIVICQAEYFCIYLLT